MRDKIQALSAEARGAFAAASLLLEDSRATLDALTFGGESREQIQGLAETLALFVRTAGDVPGESLYRWSAAKGLHPLPADGYANVAPHVRLFFDAFVATVKALAPLLEPPKIEQTTPAPKQNHVDERDTVFERYGRPDERTHRGVSQGQPTSTDQVHIFKAEPAPAFDEKQTAPARLQINTADILAKLRTGHDGESEKTTLSIDDLRALQRASDPGDVGHIAAERPEAGPEVEVAGEIEVNKEVGGETIAGKATVAKPKGKKP